MTNKVRLTERQLDVLKALKGLNHHPTRPIKWVRPLDIGGRAGTHHSGTLTTLVSAGYVGVTQRVPYHAIGYSSPFCNINRRPRETYQITPACLAVLENLDTDTNTTIAGTSLERARTNLLVSCSDTPAGS